MVATLKLIRIISVLSILTLSACGGSSSGGGAYSQEFSTDQAYENYSSGVLAKGEKFIEAPKNPVERTLYDSYYRCLSKFFEGKMDQPFLPAYNKNYDENYDGGGFDVFQDFCCSQSGLSIKPGVEVMNDLVDKGFAFEDYDIIDQVRVTPSMIKDYVDNHYTKRPEASYI